MIDCFMPKDLKKDLVKGRQMLRLLSQYKRLVGICIAVEIIFYKLSSANFLFHCGTECIFSLIERSCENVYVNNEEFQNTTRIFDTE